MTTVLVVGAGGYLGGHVVRLAARHHITAVAVPRASVPDVAALVRTHEAVAVINAAGRVHGDRADLWEANTALVERLLGAVRGTPARLVTVGSAAEYGAPTRAAPLEETAPQHPRTEYGRSKLAATNVVRGAHACGIPAVAARLFNVAGPALPATQPIGQFARAVAALPTSGGSISVGNGATTRDFVSMPFAARAILSMAVTAVHAPVINVCSGVGLAFGQIIEHLLIAAGKQAVITDEQRPVAVPSVIGSPVLLERLYGLRERIDATAAASAILGHE